MLLTLPRQYVNEMELRGSGDGTAVFLEAIALHDISLTRTDLFDITIPSQSLFIRIRLTHGVSTLRFRNKDQLRQKCVRSAAKKFFIST
jgi:hypothetical protein